MNDRFTPCASQVLGLAKKEAHRFNHDYIGTEHLVLGMVRLGQGSAAKILAGAGVKPEMFRDLIEKQVGRGCLKGYQSGLPYTPRARRVLRRACAETVPFGHTYLGTGHILLAIFAEDAGVAVRILKSEFSLDYQKVHDLYTKVIHAASERVLEGVTQEV